MIYAHVTHTCLDVTLATKLENHKKKELMIYVALATKPEKLQKNIHVTTYISMLSMYF